MRGYIEGVDPPREIHYPPRCQTEKVIMDENQLPCLKLHQKCNMKSGTVEARMTACKELSQYYPDVARAQSEEKRAEIAEKIAAREQFREERMRLRGNNNGGAHNKTSSSGGSQQSHHSNSGNFKARCADYMQDPNKFDECNKFITLISDIRHFCILHAEQIDPTFHFSRNSDNENSVDTEIREILETTEHESEGEENNDDNDSSEDQVGFRSLAVAGSQQVSHGHIPKAKLSKIPKMFGPRGRDVGKRENCIFK